MSKVAAIGCIFLLSIFLVFSCGDDGDNGAGPGDGDGDGDGDGGGPDVTAPTVVFADPPEGAVNLHLLGEITFSFSEEIDDTSVDSGDVTVVPAAPLTATLGGEGQTMTVRPAGFWPHDDTLAFTLSGMADTAGNVMTAHTHRVSTGPLDCDGIADIFEPNDAVEAATPVEADNLYEGLSICGGDKDYYEVTIDNTFKLNAKTYITYADTAGWQLHWMRADGEYYSTRGSTAITGDVEEFQRTYMPGTYYVEIYNSHSDSLIAYDLVIETGEPCAEDMFEDNDFDDEPAAVEAGLYENLSGCYLDADWYTLPGTAGDSILVTVTPETEVGIVRMTIRDGAHQVSETLRDQTEVVSRMDVQASGDVLIMVMFWEDDVVYDMEIEFR